MKSRRRKLSLLYILLWMGYVFGFVILLSAGCSKTLSGVDAPESIADGGGSGSTVEHVLSESSQPESSLPDSSLPESSQPELSPPEPQKPEQKPPVLKVHILDPAGKPLEGAVVHFKFTTGLKETKSDASGIAQTNGFPPYDIHIFHKAHSYLTLLKTEKKELYLQLSPLYNKGAMGIVTGKFHFDALKALFNLDDAEWSKRTVSFGWSGIAQRSNFLESDSRSPQNEFEKLKMLGTDVELPSQLYVDSPFGKKLSYRALSPTGKRLLWGFGAKLKADELLSLVPADTKNLDFLEIVSNFNKKFSKQMAFGYKEVDLQAGQSKNETIQLNTKLDQSLEITLEKVPSLMQQGKPVKVYALIILGALLADGSIQPLGMSIEPVQSGSRINLHYVSPTGPLKTGRYILSTLLQNTQIADKPGPSFWAGRVSYASSLPSKATVKSFIPFSTQAKFDKSSGTLTGATGPQDTFQQLELSSKDNKRWVIYFTKQDKLTLPTLPAGFQAQWSSVSLRHIQLKTGQTMHGVFSTKDFSIDKIAGYITHFTYTTL